MFKLNYRLPHSAPPWKLETVNCTIRSRQALARYRQWLGYARRGAVGECSLCAASWYGIEERGECNIYKF